MTTLLTLITLLFISFILALFSMKDVGFASEIRKLIEKKRVKGAIVFFTDSIKHYSSSSK